MKISYLVLLTLCFIKLANFHKQSVAPKSRNCHFWFQDCFEKNLLDVESVYVSKPIYFSLLLKNMADKSIDKSSMAIDTKGVMRVLYLADWDGLKNNKFKRAIDYFSLIFILVISGFHFSLFKELIVWILTRLFGILNAFNFIPYEWVSRIISLINVLTLILLYIFICFYAFSPSVVRAFVCHFKYYKSSLQFLFNFRIKNIDLFILGSFFFVDILSTSYFLSWVCYLIFSVRLSKRSFLDVCIKTCFSSLVCLAMFQRLSLLSIPISIIFSAMFPVVYFSGFLVLLFDISMLSFIFESYWSLLLYIYRLTYQYDYVFKFHSSHQSSVLLVVMLIVLFVVKGFKVERNLWMEKVY